MERFEEAVPLCLKACEVEGKAERTVQSYDETLRHFIRAVDQLQLPNSVRAFGPAHVYLFMGPSETLCSGVPSGVGAAVVSTCTQRERSLVPCSLMALIR